MSDVPVNTRAVILAGPPPEAEVVLLEVPRSVQWTVGGQPLGMGR